MQPLRVQSTGSPRGALLRCAGEIDLCNVEELRHAASHSIWSGSLHVEVDLVQITYLDSSAIEALLEAQRELSRRDGRLQVLGGPHTGKLFRLLGLDSVLHLTEVSADALPPKRAGITTRYEPDTFPNEGAAVSVRHGIRPRFRRDVR